MKTRTLRHIVCGLTFTGTIFVGLAATVCPPPPAGTAQVSVPTGGFGIDGNLEANTPTPSGIGDWIPTLNPSGSGGFVINRNGTPVNGATTFHLIDQFGSGSDNNFNGGKKVDDNPNTWTWTDNPVNNKQDINNALIHFATDANGHNWVFVSGDRLSDNGNSYIDFEFLQNTLTANANGTFTSAGPNCGRTVNDFILTLSFTKGGSNAGLCFSQWQASSNTCGFDYIDNTPLLAMLPVFGAVNTGTIPVPYGAFTNTSYVKNTFAEAGVDLTALLNNMGACFGVEIKTIMVKTKESQSNTATIVDFITPLQVDLNFGPTCGISGSDSLCPNASGNTYTAPAGADSYAWSITGNGTIVGPVNGQTVSVTAGSGCGVSFTLTLQVTKSGCTKTCSKTVTVNDTTLPVITLTAGPSGGTTALGCNPTDAAIEAAFGTASATDNCKGNVTPTFSDSAITQTGCNRSKTRTWTAVDDCNQATATRTVTWKVDGTPPVITPSAGASGGTTPLGCNPSDTAINAGLGTASATDNCSGNLTPTASDSGVTNGCNRSMTRTWTAVDDCSNRATATRAVTWTVDTMAPVITATGTPSNGVLGCNPTAAQIEAALGTAMVADDCSTVTATPSTANEVVTGCNHSQTRTWNATDNCGNVATPVSRTATWTVDTAAPVIALSGGKVCDTSENQTCPNGTPTFPTATANDVCNGDLGTPQDLTGKPVPTTRPLFYFVDTSPSAGTFVRTWHAIDSCGGSGSGNERICSFTVTCVPCNPISACTPPYPFASSNSKTSIAFSESEVLRKIQASLIGNCTPNQIQVFYNDEHALTLGINKVSVKKTTGTTTTNCNVTPLPSPYPAGTTNPLVGNTGATPTDTTTCAQNDVDVSGRPLYPVLFITDVTNCASNDVSCNTAGDWQNGGTGIAPQAVFGTWKAAAVLMDQTHNPPVTTVTPAADPSVKNNWNLDGGDTAPAGLKNEGYGAEVRWDVSSLTYQGNPLVSGHTYRLYIMVHDGDQNKAGGDSGQACVFLTMP